MITVFIPGIWDLLHVGHLRVLEKAKDLGDRLIVGIASDTAAKLDKGRAPIIDMWQRGSMVSALKCVDMAVIYTKLEFLTTLNKYKPDILAVGEQWGREKRHKDAEEWVKTNRKKMVVLPYTQGVSTTDIIARVKEQR